MAPQTYYLLMVRIDGEWHPQFGDYVRRVVDQERKDSYQEYRGNWRIVKCDDVEPLLSILTREGML
jgi:hypothetical protein